MGESYFWLGAEAEHPAADDLLMAAEYIDTDGASLNYADANRIVRTLRRVADRPEPREWR